MRQGLGKVISLLLCVSLPNLAGATGPALTGADVAKQVEQALNEVGVAASLLITEERRYYPCDTELRVSPRIADRWDTLEVSCSAPTPWSIILRTQGQVWTDTAGSEEDSVPGDMTQAVVLRQSARKGQLITADMLELAQFDRAPAHGYFSDPAALVGRRLTSNVGNGVPVRDRHLQPDWAIEEGQRIAIETDLGSITVASSGIALENGAIGDMISVRNASSNKLLQGLVSGENKISVIANMN
jgi:flagella basal body P-ring formation protein FlgA